MENTSTGCGSLLIPPPRGAVREGVMVATHATIPSCGFIWRREGLLLGTGIWEGNDLRCVLLLHEKCWKFNFKRGQIPGNLFRTFSVNFLSKPVPATEVWGVSESLPPGELVELHLLFRDTLGRVAPGGPRWPGVPARDSMLRVCGFNHPKTDSKWQQLVQIQLIKCEGNQRIALLTNFCDFHYQTSCGHKCFYCVQKPKLCPILFVHSVVIFRGRYSLVLGLGASPAQRHLFAERLSKPEALWLFTEFVNIVTVKCVLEIFKAFIAYGPHHNSQGPAFRDLPSPCKPSYFSPDSRQCLQGCGENAPY